MRNRIAFLAAALVVGGLVVGCRGNGGLVTEPTPTLDVVDSAAAEATALVQQARATAIVLEAQAQATALVEQARLAGGTPTSAVVDPVLYVSPTQVPQAEGATPGEPAGAGDDSPDSAGEPATDDASETIPVQVVSVSYAADGGMIMVNFMAPPEEAEKWWPGTVSVTDEGNGAVYNEIPVMPKIGPLIGRPKVAGQPGYVMLMNVPPYLRPGALVTVALGTYQFEHVPVQ